MTCCVLAGMVTSTSLLALLPELGQLSHTIVALVGGSLTPIAPAQG
ncbi:MAG: hypothetical protein R3E79_13875 [Caldilineaceae bacterium]